jgi:hypothetical protein
LKISFIDITWNIFQSSCCLRCTKIPGHWYKSRTISPISINFSNIITNMSINPVLSSCNDSGSGNASIRRLLFNGSWIEVEESANCGNKSNNSNNWDLFICSHAREDII